MSGNQMETKEQSPVMEMDEDEDTLEFEIEVVTSSSALSLAASNTSEECESLLAISQAQQEQQAEKCDTPEGHTPDQTSDTSQEEPVAPKVEQEPPLNEHQELGEAERNRAPAATSGQQHSSILDCDGLPGAAASTPNAPATNGDLKKQEDQCQLKVALEKGEDEQEEDQNEAERIPQLGLGGLELRQEAASQQQQQQANGTRPGSTPELAAELDTSAVAAAEDLNAPQQLVQEAETRPNDQRHQHEEPPHSFVEDEHKREQQFLIEQNATDELMSSSTNATTSGPKPKPCEWRLIREFVEYPAGWEKMRTIRPDGDIELVQDRATPLQVTAAERRHQEVSAPPPLADTEPDDAGRLAPEHERGAADKDLGCDVRIGPALDEDELKRVDVSVQLEGVPTLELADGRKSASLLDDDNKSRALSDTMTDASSSSPDRASPQTQNLLSASSSSSHLLGGLAAAASAAANAIYLEEEDLEREFDEEPEFKRREVLVKRNRNPRDEYELGEELGRGKFGTVFRCTESASGLKLAAKFVHMRRREDREDVEREVAIMSVLQHKRLLQLYDAFDDGLQEMCLITELVEGGELFERIVDDDFDLTERKATIFMRQICEGVEYMHSQQIVHLDMKPENILCLSRTGIRIKLIDFGMARRLDPTKAIRVMFGTPDFAAPEVLAYEDVTLATDMWSVGVICYVLLSGLLPFMGDSDMETMANVMRATYHFNDQAFEAISELAKDFIAKLLVRDPRQRLKPAECLKHAWLQRGGAPLEAAIRERRESNAALMISAHHRLALEQAALLTSSALTNDSPPTPPTLQPNLGFPIGFERRRSRVSFGGESTASTGSASIYSLDKRRLKKYVVRRKWHKTVHAIMALGRMGANLRLATG